MFSKHGTFKVEVNPNAKSLLVRATGPFNEEMVQEYSDAVQIAVSQLALFKQWTQLVVLDKESLYTPAAEQLLIKSLAYRKIRGLVASAVVLMPTVEGRSLITQQMTGVYEKSGISFEFFEEINDAKKWLEKTFNRSKWRL